MKIFPKTILIALLSQSLDAQNATAVSEPPIHSAKELVGKWLRTVKSGDTPGETTLTLRVNGTYTLYADVTRNGRPDPQLENGTWQWTGSGRTVRLSNQPDPLSLIAFERLPSFFSTGSAAIVYLTTIVLSFILSLALLRIYRGHIETIMGRSDDPLPEAPTSFLSRGFAAITLSLAQLRKYRRRVKRIMEGSDEPPPELPLQRTTEPVLGYISDPSSTPDYLAMRRQHLRTLAVYALAGSGQAIMATVWWISNSGQPMRWRLFVTLMLVHSWPILLAHLILLGRDFRIRVVLILGYAGILGAFAIGAGLKPLVTNGVRLSTTGQVYFLWAGLMLAPTLGVWSFLRKPIRAAGPLTFSLCLFAVTGIWLAIALMDMDYGSGFMGQISAIPRDSMAAFIVVLVVAALACSPVGWVACRMVGGLYGRKILNGQTITLDSLWLNFSIVVSIYFAIDKGVWLGIFQSVILFVIYRGLLTIGSLWLKRNSDGRPNRKLLLLRVFRKDRGSDRLLEVFGGRWLYGGSIQLIGGPDLATSTVQPNQFLDFLRGRLDSYFVKGPDDLRARLDSLDFDVDPDGRYRVNEMLCQGEVWKQAVKSLTDGTAILMDLRGFHQKKQGARYELKVLFESVSLNRFILLTDNSTNGDELRHAIRQAWQTATRGGPNEGIEAPVVRVYQINRIDSRTSVAIAKTLLSM